MTLKGIDISHYQVVTDWTAVGKAVDFCFVKASQGLVVDPMYASHRSRAEAAGLVAGAYHFLNRAESAAAQAHTFLAAAFPLDHLVLAVDVEYRQKDKTNPTYAQVLDFIGIVADATNKQPVVYTNVGWWTVDLGNAPWPRGCPLWVARWGSSYGTMPAGWPAPSFWQYTDHETVPGIKGGVDGDRFYGSISDLERLRV